MGATPKSWKTYNFAVYGGRVFGCVQNTPTGCGITFHTRQTQFGEPRVLAFFDLHFDTRSTSHFASPMDLPWQLRPNHPSHVVDGSTRLKLRHSGFLPSITWTPETGTSITLRQHLVESQFRRNLLPILSPTQYSCSRTKVRGIKLVWFSGAVSILGKNTRPFPGSCQRSREIEARDLSGIRGAHPIKHS